MPKPTTPDAYLRALPADHRTLLEKVRAQIKKAAPEAEEYIGYGLLGFKVHGRPLMYIGAAKNHCALYGARADDGLADALREFEQSKGTIQFTPEKPIPAPLMARIVKARLAALEEREGPRAAKSKPRAKTKPTARTKTKAKAKPAPKTKPKTSKPTRASHS